MWNEKMKTRSGVFVFLFENDSRSESAFNTFLILGCVFFPLRYEYWKREHCQCSFDSIGGFHLWVFDAVDLFFFSNLGSKLVVNGNR